MNIDGLTMSLLQKELAHACEGAQIQRINQIDKHSLVFKLRAPNTSHDLVITVGQKPACYLASQWVDLPKEPSSLCMFLRKHFENGRITEVKQLHDDRLLRFTIDKLALNGQLDTKYIYVELMGKRSNCIFVEKDIILESLIHVTPFMSQERQIAPKLPYELPPNAERLSLGDFTADEIKTMLETYSEDTLGQTLRKLFNGFGNTLLDEVCYRTQVTSQTCMQDLSVDALKNIANGLLRFYKEIKESTQLFQYIVPSKKSIYSPIQLTIPEIEKATLLRYTHLSPLLEKESMSLGAINTAATLLKATLTHAVKKEKKRYEKIKAELEEASLADTYKLYGDLLMIYAYLPHQYQTEVTVANYLTDSQEPITIPLKAELTISENAQQYYKQYNKLKKRLLNCQEQLKKSREKSGYYESVLYALTQDQSREFIDEVQRECEQTGLLKKKKKNMELKGPSTTLLSVSFSNGKLFIGRNNKQNDYLTHRLARPQDWWFHTLQIPGSHVVYQSTVPPTEEELLQIASFAAYYSQARCSSKVPVDITQIKNIKKPAGTPPGFVTYTQQRTVYVHPQAPNLEES